MSSPYQVPTPSAPPPKSNATLVIVLVFVGVVAVMGAAAVVVLPKMLHLHGEEAQPAATSGTTAVPARATSDSSSVPAASSAPASNASSAPPAPAAATSIASKSSRVGHAAKHSNVGHGSAAAYGQPAAEVQPDPNQNSQRAAEQQELDRLTHQYNLLEARMASFDASLNTMRQAQEQQGVNMRGDMASAQHRLHGNMDRMYAALEQKDLESAKRYLELCDRDAEKLSDFLGQ